MSLTPTIFDQYYPTLQQVGSVISPLVSSMQLYCYVTFTPRKRSFQPPAKSGEITFISTFSLSQLLTPSETAVRWVVADLPSLKSSLDWRVRMMPDVSSPGSQNSCLQEGVIFSSSFLDTHDFLPFQNQSKARLLHYCHK